MNIARLRHRVTLLKPIRAPDEYGGARLEYKEVTATWADFLRHHQFVWRNSQPAKQPHNPMATLHQYRSSVA